MTFPADRNDVRPGQKALRGIAAAMRLVARDAGHGQGLVLGTLVEVGAALARAESIVAMRATDVSDRYVAMVGLVLHTGQGFEAVPPGDGEHLRPLDGSLPLVARDAARLVERGEVYPREIGRLRGARLEGREELLVEVTGDTQ